MSEIDITQEDRQLVHAMIQIMPLAAQMVLTRPSEFYALAARHRIAARERAIEEAAKRWLRHRARKSAAGG